ncbi:hypothetical protein NPIL_28011 [Nephila pilipes]|uniref:DUF5641 domain-containing protein n=1 Tax=Nephila pilipes TaxID=299642 RepID=A0A8X6Q560_NEPPI|nr:hypothetical protein NPIL_28011 [Nephila pilipes]
MLVLIKDDQLPICKLSLGHIVNVIPGKDENVRVVCIEIPKETEIVNIPADSEYLVRALLISPITHKYSVTDYPITVS